MTTSDYSALRAVWLPVNQCWQVMFGDAPTGLGAENRRLFPTLADLREACARCGLRVDDRIANGPASVVWLVVDDSADARDYNRDLALRARNGQVGSGMRFRG